MKGGIKLLAAGVALALGSMSAMAAPVETGGMFLTAWNPTNQQTVVVNLGVTSADFLANNLDSGYVLSGSGLDFLSSWLGTADLSVTRWHSGRPVQSRRRCDLDS